MRKAGRNHEVYTSGLTQTLDGVIPNGCEGSPPFPATFNDGDPSSHRSSGGHTNTACACPSFISEARVCALRLLLGFTVQQNKSTVHEDKGTDRHKTHHSYLQILYFWICTPYRHATVAPRPGHRSPMSSEPALPTHSSCVASLSTGIRPAAGHLQLICHIYLFRTLSEEGPRVY